MDKTLRQLAKNYAKGVIDKATYRKARGELISGIIDGSRTLQENTYLPPVEMEDNTDSITEARNREKTQIKATPSPAASQQGKTATQTKSAAAVTGKKSVPWMGILIAVTSAAILVLIGLIMIADTPQKSVEPEMTTLTPSTSIGITRENKAGNKIIDEFLAQKSWHKEALENFKSRWNALSPEQIAATLNSAALKRLTNAIHRQLLEEQSLATIGDSQAALQRQELLIDFASSIGINDPRLSATMIEIKKN